MPPVEILPAAEAELTAAAAYYERISPDLRNSFLDHFEAAMDRMRRFPEAAPIEYGEVRRESLSRFPYNVMYIHRASRLVIVAVMHQKRRPDYWRHRLSGDPAP